MTSQDFAPPDASTQAPVVLRAVSRLENFGAFRTLAPWTLPDPPLDAGQWAFLFGAPGAGKTTLLRALALALAGQEGAHLLPNAQRDSFRRDGRDAQIGVAFTHATYTTQVMHSSLNRVDGVRASHMPFARAFGYGSTRSSRGSARGNWFHPPLASLFEPGFLFPAARVLLDADGERLRGARAMSTDRSERIWSALVAVLRGIAGLDDVTIAQYPNVIVRHPTHGPVRLDRLGDGELALLTLALDLTQRFAILDPDTLAREGTAGLTGVVLIDGLDLFLHPTAQVTVQARLRAVFPRLSFVVTAASPLVLAEARPEEVFQLHRDADGDAHVEPVLNDPRLSTPTELFTHHAGLPWLFPSEVGRAYSLYTRFAANPFRTDDEEAALAAYVRTLQAAGVTLPFDPAPRPTPNSGGSKKIAAPGEECGSTDVERHIMSNTSTTSVPFVLPPSVYLEKRAAVRRAREEKIRAMTRETITQFNDCLEKGNVSFVKNAEGLPIHAVYASHDREYAEFVKAAFCVDGPDGWIVRLRPQDHRDPADEEPSMQYHVEILDPEVEDSVVITQFKNGGE